jgi:hypothetical protein
MKKKSLLLSFSALLVLGAVIIFTFGSGFDTQKKYSPRKTDKNEIGGAIEWWNTIRNNRATGTIDIQDVLRARKEIAQLIDKKVVGLQWYELGPNNVGGRTRAILVDKDNSQLLYAGAVSGGLWKSATGGSSWVNISSFPDVNVSCIAQSPINGNIYVGTGESYANVGDIMGTPGFMGSGLYESTDGGNTWQIFHNASPTANSLTSEWAFVNRIAVQPGTGRVYAATNKGLRYWDGSVWFNPVYLANNTTPNTGNCSMLAMATDGTIAASISNKGYISLTGNDHDFFDKSPATAIARTEYAFAPSNPNYIYACAAAGTGALKGVYRSTDKGNTWQLIGPGGAEAFNLFGSNNQGSYDNVIAVYPNNPDKILVGGIDIWRWQLGGNFTQISNDFLMHVDEHAIVFDPQDPNIIYFGSDGGVAKSGDGGNSFLHINRNYNVTQFYGVAINAIGSVMCGTQDNSNPYVRRSSINDTARKGRVLFGGDGGWAAFSDINPDAGFGSSQYANIWRSDNINSINSPIYQAASDCLFMSKKVMTGAGVPPGQAGFGTFVTPMILWECFNDIYSPDSTSFIADTIYDAGDIILAKSVNNQYPFYYQLPVDMNEGDTLRVKDIISSRYFVYANKGIWMTRGAINLGKMPYWNKISSIQGYNITMTISKDGNYMFVGTDNGSVYRLSNIRAAIDDKSAEISSVYCVIEQKLIHSFSGRDVTSIAVDPNDPSRIVVTLGNYGNTDYVYFSSNALDASPTFTSKQGSTAGKKLPAMPVYSSLIEVTNPNLVILGTEYGLFATENITNSAANMEWSEENADQMNPATNISRVPVLQIKQQVYSSLEHPGVTNYGVIYIGTHGRGFFQCKKYYSGIQEDNSSIPVAKASLNIYPNPVTDKLNINYSLSKAGNVLVNIYDITGKVVKSLNLNNRPIGLFNAMVDCSSFERGTYILQLISGTDKASAKFVVAK